MSPSTVSATIDQKAWAGQTATLSYDRGTGIFKLVADRPGDSVATELKLVLINSMSSGPPPTTSTT
jgi:hypothetical protein